MTCEMAEKQVPEFIRGEMDAGTARQFLEHIDRCPSCMEELSIQFLVTVGMERLEEGEAFNLNRELGARINQTRLHLRIRSRLQRSLYCFEALAVLTAVLIVTMLVV